MTVIEVFNTIEFWFGLATGVACHKLAGKALKQKLSAITGTTKQRTNNSNGDSK